MTDHTTFDELLRDLYRRCRLPYPEQDVRDRKRAHIRGEGWLIWYLFGRDERGAFVDWLECHRMTNDTHTRLYEDGTQVDLPAEPEMRRGSFDPEEDARLEAEYIAECRRIDRLLRDKGFVVDD